MWWIYGPVIATRVPAVLELCTEAGAIPRAAAAGHDARCIRSRLQIAA
eukprot:SAG31_NODE_36786_length_310_cov_0.810427_1_plen_47_part_10